MATGADFDGRALARIEITLDAATVTPPHDVPDVFAGLELEGDEAERIWQELQADIAAGFDDSRLVVVEGSGHMIPLEAPHLHVVPVLLGSGVRLFHHPGPSSCRWTGCGCARERRPPICCTGPPGVSTERRGSSPGLPTRCIRRSRTRRRWSAGSRRAT
jgi:hypothetical protein